jgi:cytochrome c oxidase subunit IV
MQHTSEATAVAAHPPGDTKIIWRTLGILTLITIAELIVGMFIAPKNPHLKLWFGIFYLICTLAKAFYIVAEFMHLGHEIKNLIMTIVFPLLIFIWFIIAFLWDGDSYKKLRDNNNPQLKKYPPKEATQKQGGDHQEGGHH